MKNNYTIFSYNIADDQKWEYWNSWLPTLYSIFKEDKEEEEKNNKWIKQLTDKIKNIFFDWKTSTEFKKTVNRITSIYYIMKYKFYEDLRDDGTRYFEHLKEVANITLTLPNPSIKKVEIALWHDAMEDKNISFNTIKDHSWIEITIGVEALSKKHWQDYSKDKKVWKELRNKEYFWHLKSFKSMKNYVQEICKKRNVELSEEEINSLVQDIFDVKFADRIHNLSTQWDPDNIEKVERKVNETEEYFLDIAKQLNPEAYKILLWHTVKLKQNAEKYFN